jgi:hypothetical protein
MPTIDFQQILDTLYTAPTTRPTRSTAELSQSIAAQAAYSLTQPADGRLLLPDYPSTFLSKETAVPATRGNL